MRIKLNLIIIFIFTLISCATTDRADNNIKLINYIGMTEDEIIKSFGEDYFQNIVNSTSSKSKMPSYLADYLMAGDKVIEAKLLIWTKENVYMEIALKKVNNQWIVFGYTVYEID